jgi:hypothetical protein
MSKVILVFVACFILFSIGVFVRHFFLIMESKHQDEIMNAKLDVIEDFRESNNRRLNK